MFASVKQLHQMALLRRLQLRGLSLKTTPAPGQGQGHALLRTLDDQVPFNSATIANALNSSRPTGSVGSCTVPLRDSATWPSANSSAIARASRHRPSQAIKFGHHKGVARTDRIERFAQAGSLTVLTAEALVDIDAIRRHTQHASWCRCEARSCSSVEQRITHDHLN